MIREIQAKTMLSKVPGDDRLFGLTYNLNLYRGCPHGCIYCDSRSECYQIENFDDILVKINAVELLDKELRSKRVIGTIGFGSMSDPYLPVEKHYNLTRRALQVLVKHHFPAHIITKSDLVLKDLDVLMEVSEVFLSVGFTLTTTDDDLARKIEPYAPLPSARLSAMRVLADNGIYAGTVMMPILPFLEDNPQNITAIVEQTAAHGGQFIIPWLGMSLRDRQRAYYYEQLKQHFPGLKEKYARQFGESYGAPANQAKALERLLRQECAKHGIDMAIRRFEPRKKVDQLSLW